MSATFDGETKRKKDQKMEVEGSFLSANAPPSFEGIHLQNSGEKPPSYKRSHLSSVGFHGFEYQLHVLIARTLLLLEQKQSFAAVVEKMNVGNLDDVVLMIRYRERIESTGKMEPKEDIQKVIEAYQVKDYSRTITVDDFLTKPKTDRQVKQDTQPQKKGKKSTKKQKMHIGKFFEGWLNLRKEHPHLIQYPDNLISILYTNTDLDLKLTSCIAHNKKFKTEFIEGGLKKEIVRNTGKAQVKEDLLMLLFQEAFNYLDVRKHADALVLDEEGRLALFRDFLKSLVFKIKQPSLEGLKLEIQTTLSKLVKNASAQVYLSLYHAIYHWFSKSCKDNKATMIRRKDLFKFLKVSEAQAHNLVLLQAHTQKALSNIHFETMGRTVDRPELDIFKEALDPNVNNPQKSILVAVGAKGNGKSGLVKQAIQQWEMPQYLFISAAELAHDKSLRQMLTHTLQALSYIKVVVIDAAESLIVLGESELQSLIKSWSNDTRRIVFTITPEAGLAPAFKGIMANSQVVRIQELALSSVQDMYPEMLRYKNARNFMKFACRPYNLKRFLTVTQADHSYLVNKEVMMESPELAIDTALIEGQVTSRANIRRKAWVQLARKIFNTHHGINRGVLIPKKIEGLEELQQEGIVVFSDNLYSFDHDLILEHGVMTYLSDFWDNFEENSQDFWRRFSEKLQQPTARSLLNQWVILNHQKISEDLMTNVKAIEGMGYFEALLNMAIETKQNEFLRALLSARLDKEKLEQQRLEKEKKEKTEKEKLNKGNIRKRIRQKLERRKNVEVSVFEAAGIESLDKLLSRKITNSGSQRTPLEQAILSDNPVAITILLEFGASLSHPKVKLEFASDGRVEIAKPKVVESDSDEPSKKKRKKGSGSFDDDFDGQGSGDEGDNSEDELDYYQSNNYGYADSDGSDQEQERENQAIEDAHEEGTYRRDCLKEFLTQTEKYWDLKPDQPHHSESECEDYTWEFMQDEQERMKPNNEFLYVHLAAMHNRAACLRAIIQHSTGMISLDNNLGESPLQTAISHRATEAVTALRALGASVHHTDNLDETALHNAAYSGNIDAAALLLEAGADPNDRSSTGITACHIAMAKMDLPMIRLLLEYGGDFVTFPDNFPKGMNLVDFLANIRDENLSGSIWDEEPFEKFIIEVVHLLNDGKDNTAFIWGKKCKEHYLAANGREARDALLELVPEIAELAAPRAKWSDTNKGFDYTDERSHLDYAIKSGNPTEISKLDCYILEDPKLIALVMESPKFADIRIPRNSLGTVQKIPGKRWAILDNFMLLIQNLDSETDHSLSDDSLKNLLSYAMQADDKDILARLKKRFSYWQEVVQDREDDMEDDQASPNKSESEAETKLESEAQSEEDEAQEEVAEAQSPASFTPLFNGLGLGLGGQKVDRQKGEKPTGKKVGLKIGML